MIKNLLKGAVFTAIVVIAGILLPVKTSYAYFYEDLAASEEEVSVYVGEKISLKHYAPIGGSDTYRLGSGTGSASIDSDSGVVYFTKSGSLYIYDDVRDVSGNVLETYSWSFRIINNPPEITKQPSSETGYYQDSVTFSVETRQDSSTLTYQWFIVHSNSMASYPRSDFNVDSWNEPKLTIHNLQFWMNGARVYCMISNTTDQRLVVYTINEPISETPQLTVIKRPVDSTLYLTELDLPTAKNPLDFDFRLTNHEADAEAYRLVNISKPSYTLDGKKLDSVSQIQLGDKLQISFTLTLADKSNFAFPETLTVVWGDMRAVAEQKSQSQMVVTYEYEVTGSNPYYLGLIRLNFVDADSSKSVLPRLIESDAEHTSASILSWNHEENQYEVVVQLSACDGFFMDERTEIFINGILASHDAKARSQDVLVSLVYQTSLDGALVVEQPIPVVCYDGDNVIFHVEAYFAQNYQWYVRPYGSDTEYALNDDMHYRGTKTDTLSIKADVEYDLSSYYCVIGDIRSNEAAIKVHFNPNVTPWGPTEDWQDYGIRVIIFVALALIVMGAGIWLLLRSIYGKWYLKNMKRK